MPVYEYACNQCNQRFEKLFLKQPQSADQAVDCPNCKATNTRRVLSSFSSPASSETEFCPPGGCGSCPNPGGCGNWN